MSGHLNIVAVIASEDVFGEIEPLLSRTDLDVSHVRSGQHALTLAHKLAYDLILSQHPLADVGLKELLAGLRSSASASHVSPVLILTRETRLDSMAEFLDGVTVQACCIDVAPEQLERALVELVGLAIRVNARVLVEMEVGLEGGAKNRVCQTVNLSESGLLIRSLQPPPLGEQIPMKLHLPDRFEPIRVLGEVVRHTGPEEEVRGAGLRLLRVDAANEERLAAFIAREQSLTHQPDSRQPKTLL